MSDMNRYKRQLIFYGIGEDGQKKLLASRVCIIGMGALGSVIANNLCRSGVGYIRMIDRDYVETSNLQRQILFTESDAAESLPKVIAAYNRLSEFNSDVALDPVATDANASNIEELIKDTDLVIDGTDNFETRFLINEACDKHRIKWIYGGAVAGGGATMNILQDGGPCFRCFMPEMPEEGSYPTCGTVGVINSITGIIASYEAAEAIKILIGADSVSRQYHAVEAWENNSDYFDVDKNPDCPVCVQKRYELLGRVRGSHAVSLCGNDSWQVLPEIRRSVDFDVLAERLSKLGAVKVTKFLLGFRGQGASFKLFPDGRAIVNDVPDGAAARSVYAEYIGL
ncbi:MAG: ThiF family adenylyltransferase [Clostridiales Family XIII bacterium]|jgi:adenylyltransferase/sulfurtransferase|nr:ThiF family adenylyltransferase [Clostridiales Family XIII bacterium]